MYEFFLITFAVLADVLFPGPNFILCSSIAINSGKKQAFQLIYGILLACFIWCVFLILGVVKMFTLYPWLKDGVKLIGSFYLTLIGFKMLYVSILNKSSLFDKISTKRKESKIKIFSIGFINCLLNPEVGLFYMIMFTRVIDKYGINYTILSLYSLEFIIIQFGCFALIALSFAKIANKITKYLRILNTLLSFLLIYLAIKLFLGVIT